MVMFHLEIFTLLKHFEKGVLSIEYEREMFKENGTLLDSYFHFCSSDFLINGNQ